ncbi:MAG: hypothetical protein ACRELA_25630 [Candidatus Rokuibacteriota bacterium]
MRDRLMPSRRGDLGSRWGDRGRGDAQTAPGRADGNLVSTHARSVAWCVVAIAIVLAPAAVSRAQPAQPTPLKNLVDDQVVARIGYCKGEYTLTMASGAERRYPEINLRFKTDASRTGPEPGKPALLRAGMQGDRGQVIFGSLEDLKRFLIDECRE